MSWAVDYRGDSDLSPAPEHGCPWRGAYVFAVGGGRGRKMHELSPCPWERELEGDGGLAPPERPPLGLPCHGDCKVPTLVPPKGTIQHLPLRHVWIYVSEVGERVRIRIPRTRPRFTELE